VARGGILREWIRKTGFDVARRDALANLRAAAVPDFDPAKRAIVNDLIGVYTMTSAERIGNVIDAVRYVVEAGITGAVVECGVWRGGSMMAAARGLIEAGETDRELWLYDTFGGMSEPSEVDRTPDGRSAQDFVSQAVWRDRLRVTLPEVQANMRRTSYPGHLLRFIEGKVEDTLPCAKPQRVAVLRLDTDWYESTRAELNHLYPLVTPGGIVIIDDYGAWEGSRKAVDEFLEAQQEPIFLWRIDNEGRAFIKPGPSSSLMKQSPDQR
jgi:O-methyltransferase